MDQDNRQGAAEETARSAQSARSGSMGESRFPSDGEGWEGAPEGAPVSAMRELGQQIEELGEYASYFLSAKWDGIKLSVKNAGIYAVLGVVGLIAGGALVVTAVVQVCSGIAQGLGVLFGGRIWLGNLVTGVLLLALVGVGAYYGMSKLMGKSKKATEQKYELRKRQQRKRFATDVERRARARARAAERTRV